MGWYEPCVLRRRRRLCRLHPDSPTCLPNFCADSHPHHNHPSIHPTTSSLLAIFRPLLRISKTFQAFSSPCSSSRQIEEGFLNDPLIIGSGVTLGFFFSSAICMPSCLAAPPNLFISLWFLRGFLFFFSLLYPPPPFHPHPSPTSPSRLAFWSVCAHEVECRKVPESISPPFFFLKNKFKKPLSMS